MPDIRWHKDRRPKYSKETATVNGHVFPTVLVKGTSRVQRFRANKVVRDLLDAATEGRKLDLNEIWITAQKGSYSRDEMHELYRLIGYSVCGFAEVFPGDRVGSSMWK